MIICENCNSSHPRIDKHVKCDNKMVDFPEINAKCLFSVFCLLIMKWALEVLIVITHNTYIVVFADRAKFIPFSF